MSIQWNNFEPQGYEDMVSVLTPNRTENRR